MCNIGGRPVKLVAVYLSPLRSLLDADLSECFGFLAGDLNAKHREWNSRVNSPRGVLLRDFATANSCYVHGPDVPTTVPSCPTHTPNVLDIVFVKDFLLPVNLTVCSALSSNHFQVIVDLYGRSSFRTLPDRPCFERVDCTRDGQQKKIYHIHIFKRYRLLSSKKYRYNNESTFL